MKKQFMAMATITVCLLYLVWRALFTLPLDLGMVSLVGAVILLIAEASSIIEALVNLKCVSVKKEIEKPWIPGYMYPDVDVLIATHSEDAELLTKTVNGCLHMDYPDKSKVHIYLCDDANRPEIKELADRMGVGCFQLEKNTEAKAGNLNNALRNTDSPLIVTFDADMIPRSEFLYQTVPYFFLPKMIKENGEWRLRTEEEIDENFKMGFVQTPQNFYNPDLFQFNFGCEDRIPNEQDYFFKDVNVGRNGTNTPIYAGSNTMITRESLEAVGYIHTNNITEDFATGIDIQANGFTCMAVDNVLASGLAPNDFGQLVQQRQRWGRGCVQTLMSSAFWKNDLSFMAKLSYLNCLSYWWTFIRRAIFILSPIVFVLFDLVLLETTVFELLIIWLPSYLVFNQAIKSISGKIRVNRWSNIVDTILFPYLIFPILCETMGITLRKFAVTDKGNSVKRNSTLKYAIPHMILFGATLMAIFVAGQDLLFGGNLGSVFVFFWLMVNGYYLFMAIICLSGRINFRSSERYKTKLKVNCPDFEFEGKTLDISEGGFRCILDGNVLPEVGKTYDFNMQNLKTSVILRGKIVRKIQKKEEFEFGVQLEKESSSDLEWLNMIYGEKPTLAETVESTPIEELVRVIMLKLDKTMPELETEEDKKGFNPLVYLRLMFRSENA